MYKKAQPQTGDHKKRYRYDARQARAIVKSASKMQVIMEKPSMFSFLLKLGIELDHPIIIQ